MTLTDHVNGTEEFQLTCTSCHGNQNAAPPIDTHGVTGTTLVSVGAHQAHVVPSLTGTAIACSACHGSAADGYGNFHSDGIVEVAFTGLTNQGTSTSYTRQSGTSATCASSYCHGGSTALKGGTGTTPSWTTVNGTYKACTACHGDPPPAPHVQRSDCGTCHIGYTSTSVNVARHVNGTVDFVPLACTSCHGDVTRVAVDGAGAQIAPAPPVGTRLETDATQPAVGAHQAHLTAGAYARALDCIDCHEIPTSTLHATGEVEFDWSALAKGAGTPRFDPIALTCSSTYCHGNFTGGNAANAPKWTAGSAGAQCDSCHGLPAAPHPQLAACERCHVGYTATAVNLTDHVNGTVDYLLTCTSCHGNQNPAPPIDTHGVTGTTLVSVGAHQSHVAPTLTNTAIACSACHGSAADGYGNFHSDGVVEVAFTGLTNQGTSTSYAKQSGTSATCASSYCHGGSAALKGGTGTTPVWTAVDGTYKACTACHGDPPPPPHLQRSDCGTCHGGYTSTSVNLTLHVNGAIDVIPLTCSTCHGQARTPVASATGTDALGANLVLSSPPLDSAGSAVSPAVGTHLAHVNQGDVSVPGALSNALACTSCHVVPTSTTHANGQTDVTFGGLATAQGAVPTPYSFTTRNCASTYCHGQFVGGKGADTIAWTAGGKLSCTACHLSPPVPAAASGGVPASYHPNDPTCTDCHPAGYSATTVVAATHVDGQVTLNANRVGCVQCHGTPGLVANDPATADPNVAGSPPKDSKGNSANTTLGVGAHTPHVNHTIAGRLSNAIHCTECHGPDKTDRTHADGNSAPIFGTVAKTGGLSPTYSAGTCASTYCHGNFTGGKNASPAWNVPGQLGCTDCHLSPPVPAAASGSVPASYHPNDPTCTDCHPAGYSTTTVVAATHVDGAVALNPNRTGCVACHGTPGLVANDATNADPLVASAPPNDSKGNSATTTLGVGAHAAHVNHALSGRLSYPVKCSECHGPNKTDKTHADGSSTPIFGTLAKTGGLSPTYSAGTCGATYCHGNFTGGRNASLAWNVPGQLGCNACHGSGTGASALPPGPVSSTLHHPQNPNCGACHAGYTATTVPASAHVDGVVQKPTGCTACHGDLSVANAASTDVRAAPGGDANAVDSKGNLATATSQRGVGAHAVHLLGMTWRATPIACNECHTVPATADVAHADGNPVVTFGTLARTAWSGQPAITPAWNGAGGATTLTCSSVYCHGAFKNGANAALTWATPSAVVCGTCHGVSTTSGPGGTHPTITAGQTCGSCHGGTYTNTSIDPALHMNGVLDGGGEPTASSASNRCGGCHANVFGGMNGGTAAVTRHTLGNVSGTNDSPIDTNTTWPTGAGLAGVAAAQRSCVNMCHEDHPHTLTSPATATHQNNVYVDAGSQTLRVATSSTSNDKAATDFDNTRTNGGLCLSCHKSPVETAAPVLHPPVSQAAFNASKHNYTANTQGTWGYQLHDASTFTRNCTKCHASNAEGNTPTFSASGGIQGPHYSPNPSLLSGPTNPGATTNVGLPASGFVCYNCHASTASPANSAQGNRSGKDVLAATQKKYFHPVNLDSKHDTGAENVTATGYNSGRYSGTNRHASCMDCHEPHQSGGTLVSRTATATSTRNRIQPGSPLAGASGVGFTPPTANWTATATGNFAFKAAATAEYEICFKCHTSYAFGTTVPTATAANGGSGQAETDQAQEFSTGNLSGHPVVAGLSSYANSGTPKNLAAAVLLAPWSSNMGTQTMLCTDCHNTDTASPAVQGPHGSAYPFMLAGANKRWPYQSNGTTLWALSNSETSIGTSDGLFCRNCHPRMYTSSSAYSNYYHYRVYSQHSSSLGTNCVSCHLVIPHGGKVGRLVATTNTPARYLISGNRIIFATFRKSATPATSLGTWSSNGCTQHSGSGDAW
ncbi:MAG TPA: CxxxxCH/CxxCH domain-containing protein [Anaeromyxobacteraceae bacterium]|nr:CxxxxCH/CxxCH domain-containing protein [Anaeromyxobacteraceae bacterium]